MQVWKPVACALLLSLATGVSMTPGADPPPASAEGRGAQLVSLVRDNFYDANEATQWAARNRYLAGLGGQEPVFATVANRALAELRVSHTGYYDRHAPEFYALRSIFERVLKMPITQDSPGADITPENIVRVVFRGGPADAAGLRRGDLIETADEKPFHRIDAFQGKAGKPVVLRVRRHREADPISLKLTPRTTDPKKEWLEAQIAGSRIIELKGKRIGYVPLFSGAGEEFQEALRDAMSDTFQDADALVIDFRNGFGGCNPTFVNLFNRFPPRLTSIGRDGKTTVMDSQWRKPVVLLINGGSRSGKEVVAFALKKHKLAMLVGTRTGGAVVAGRCFPLGTDAVLYLAVQDVRVDDHRLEGVGVAPDIEVPDDLPYADGRDPQLEKALSVAAGL